MKSRQIPGFTVLKSHSGVTVQPEDLWSVQQWELINIAANRKAGADQHNFISSRS
jgi:hypothetical protein